MKILIDFWHEKERREACLAFVEEGLNMTASSIKILWAEETCE